MDGVFAPFPAPAGLQVPTGTEVVYLRPALFVLQGRYFDPGSGRDRPLPPHRFALVSRGTEVVAEGTVSDADGISTIFDVDRSAVSDDAAWELVLIPVARDCDDGDLAESYSTKRELWVDVENGTWVKQGFPDDTPGLLRIPLWSTRIKSERGGGFLEGYDADPGFAQTGTIADERLQPKGTHDRPWVLQIDHGWLRTWVQFHGYDPLRKTDGALGVPLLLRSRVPGFPSTGMRGGSSVMDAEGSIGMVHAGTAETLDLLSYMLVCDERPWVSMETGVRTKNPYSDLRLLESHYPLPSYWLSLGVEAWIGPKQADARARRPFGVLRHLGTDPAHPICFHLDDIVICEVREKEGRVNLRDAPAARVCVLDHRLAIRDQASTNGDPLPYSKSRLKSALLRGEELMFVRGEGMDHVTRLLEIAGVLYSVATDRTSGGANPRDDDGEVHPQWCTGLRAALPMEADCAPEQRIDGRSVLRQHGAYFIDASAVEESFGQVKGRLFHWLVYLPCHVRARYAEREDPNAIAALPIVEAMLWVAAQRWDQAHPAHPGRKGKNYALVADSAANEPAFVRLRHHFGAWEQPNGSAALHDDVRPRPNVLPVQVVPRAGRANCADSRLELFLADRREGPLEGFDSPPWDLGPASFGELADPFDGTKGTRFALAHELGHAIGLGDEYLELRDDLPLFRLSGKEQLSPFVFDPVSMMTHNCVPRLRHMFRRYEELAAARAGKQRAAVLDEQLELRDWGGPHPLRWAIEGSADFGGATELVLGSRRVGLCPTRLFALGDDESSRGAMIARSSPLDEPFDAVLVIGGKLEFMPPPKRPRAAIASAIYDRFARRFVDAAQAPKLMVRGGQGGKRRRVLLLFQPLFALTEEESRLAGPNLVVDLNHKGTVEETKTEYSIPVMRLALGDLGTWLMRHLLRPGAELVTLSRADFCVADVAPLVDMLVAERIVKNPVVEEIA